jgi:GNAT superfamily N-acetyltransferase
MLPTSQSGQPATTAFRIRAATPDDRSFMFDQAARLAAAANLPWHAEGDLLAAAEDWARAQGFRLIGLDVFANNRRARAFYARLGYQDDSLRVTKALRDSDT